jgi:hypothetical protein
MNQLYYSPKFLTYPRSDGLKGADIGSNAVIDPRSIITKKILPSTLAIGIPAKVVRTNIRWFVESI